MVFTLFLIIWRQAALVLMGLACLLMPEKQIDQPRRLAEHHRNDHRQDWASKADAMP